MNDTPARSGPHPAVPLASALVITVTAAVVLAAGSGGALSGSPLDGVSAAAYDRHSVAAIVSGFLNTGAAIPLLVATATIAARQHRLGLRVPGPTIGLVGGVGAALLIGLSGMLTWTLGQVGPSGLDDGAYAVPGVLAFAAGGPAFAMALGLFTAGVAVPALLLRLLPRALAVIGLALAVLAELSWFTMIVPAASPLLPVGRFGTLIWLTVAAFLLPRDRRSVRGSTPTSRT